MDLSSWLVKYPGIRVATKADNQRLLTFYDNQPMGIGKVGLQYLRGPDFFAMMEARSDQGLVLVHEDSHGEIQGVATFSFREGMIRGERKMLAYLGDLRVGLDRSLIRVWKKAYAELLASAHEIPEMAYTSDFLTSVIDDNSVAQRALVSDKRGLIQYTPLVRYKMVNIFRRFALSRKRVSSLFHVGRLHKSDLPELCAFFESEHNKNDFGFACGELLRRAKSWPGLLFENAIVVRDLRGKICGFTWLWNTNDIKKTIFHTTSPALKAAGSLISGLPRSGQPIHFLYMTALTVSTEGRAQEEIKSLIVDHAYEMFRSSDCNFLSLCEFESDSFGDVLRPYICFRTPMALYSVSSGSRPATAYSQKIGFEMAVV